MEAVKTFMLKPFVPAKDFAISRQFYLDLGFSQDFESPDLVGFSLGSVSFLLQNFYDPALANNLMLQLIVDDAHGWYHRIAQLELAQKYAIKCTEPAEQPWGVLDFVLIDPSGVLWRISEDL